MEALADRAKLRRSLLAFYRKHGRDLPWRKTRDPYAIWVSEVMLQQTQVQTATPRFGRFLRQFPDVAALAASEESTVCEAWAGLGYYRRARNLHKAARAVVAEWAGRLPDEEVGLRRLPGIGAYTAAAVASIAYGERVAAVDGNLVRVLARLFALPGRASDPALIKAVRAEAQLLVDCQQPGDVNQALMDVGATVCLPETPACPACPLRSWCLAHAQGIPMAYPGKAVKSARQDLRVAFAWIERRGALLLEQRHLDGLWPGLWELPSASGPHADRDLATRLGQSLGPPLTSVSHELTHRHVTADVYPARATRQSGQKAEQKWWTSPLTAPLSSLARKAILAAGKAIAGSTVKMS